MPASYTLVQIQFSLLCWMLHESPYTGPYQQEFQRIDFFYSKAFESRLRKVKSWKLADWLMKEWLKDKSERIEIVCSDSFWCVLLNAARMVNAIAFVITLRWAVWCYFASRLSKPSASRLPIMFLFHSTSSIPVSFFLWFCSWLSSVPNRLPNRHFSVSSGHIFPQFFLRFFE